MKLVYRLGWLSFRFFYWFFFRWTIYHNERVPLEGPVILASNHASFLDPPLVGTPINREINYLARESLFNIPGVGWLIRQWNSVPVDRDGGGGRGLKAILNRLKKGGAIILFPEGTRTSTGELLPARSGIGLTVIKSNAPVVPARIFGSYEAFNRHMKIPRFFIRKVAVKYGEPMYFEKERAEAKTCSKDRSKEIYQEVADELMRQIASLEPCFDRTTFAGS
jgi:1-acyl-sn-glycerol-3-phosphate acyltransferase